MFKSIFLYGIHVASILLEKHHKYIKNIYILDNYHKNNQNLKNFINYVNKNKLNINIKFVDKNDLNKLALNKTSSNKSSEHVNHLNHQGIVVECDQNLLNPESSESGNDLKSFIENLINNKTNHKLFILVLDGIQDPQNLGACIRSAEAFGVDCIIIPKNNSCSVNNTVVKVSSGAALLLPVFQVVNLARSLEYLKEQGVWLYGSYLDHNIDTDNIKDTNNILSKQDLTDNIALVMGSEGTGMRKLTEKLCDYKFTIPMQGETESLNVSVATGICLYEVNRQRNNI